jgi:hypothetical protein
MHGTYDKCISLQNFGCRSSKRGHFERPRSILEDNTEVRYERLEKVIVQNSMSMAVTTYSLVKVY